MNFQNKFYVYDKNAVIQKIVAGNLNEFIKDNLEDENIDSVFEIGCGTGIFTKIFINSHMPQQLILNDYFDTRNYLQEISYNDFIVGDIEKVAIPESDIVVSSSVLQWIKELERVFEKISKSCKVFSFSIYTKGNLIEIMDHFNISLDYYDSFDIAKLLSKYFKVVKYKKESLKKEFDTPMEALKSLKNTGVTGFKRASIQSVRSFKANELTYEVGYFFCSNK